MRQFTPFLLALQVAFALTACKNSDTKPTPDASTPTPDGGPSVTAGVAPVSRSLALSADGTSLWVVNTESDSVSLIDVASLQLSQEILLGNAAPAVNPDSGRYDPAIRPRAITLVDSLGKAYVAGEAANSVFVVDTLHRTVSGQISVGFEPTAVVAAQDGSAVYVVNHQSATVQKIDPHTDTVVATLSVSEHPWGASLSSDGQTLYVSHLLLNPGVTAIATAGLTTLNFTPIPDQPVDPSLNKLLPSGEVRGAYTVVPQPKTGELWVPHLLLATGTPQPELDFESTVFPTISWLSPSGGEMDHRLLFRPSSLLTAPGAFADSVSGFHDIAFTPDGDYALVADAQSEDVMVFDANAGFESSLVRPTPSALLEGIVVDAAGTHAYVQGRSTHNVTVLSIQRADGGVPTVTVQGSAIECLASDPMPAQLRLGMRLFYSSNSAQYPLTQNFWVACSTCHLEGQSDAVTWEFAQGPRDTPSNAGGPINTGFLFRQAVRNDVIDYDQTIRVEQGGAYYRTNPTQLPQLQAIADFTNYAIPFPQNPNVNPDGGLTASQTNGQALFASRCSGCHSGAFFTDSASGNPTLDMSGPILLHDIGTCVDGGTYPDNASVDIDGNPRSPCEFDTPTLRGIFATAPYFHDGSARTLGDAVARVPYASDLDAGDQGDLVNYLLTL